MLVNHKQSIQSFYNNISYIYIEVNYKIVRKFQVEILHFLIFPQIR